MEELQAGGAKLELSGFEAEKIGELISALPQNIEVDAPIVEDVFDVSKALEKIKEPETRYGNVWQLGRHRLVFGDATNPEDVALLMEGAKASLVVTDPPYNVAVESDSKRLAADGRQDDMPAEEFTGFLHAVFEQYASIMVHTAAIYVFHPSSYQNDFEVL